MAPHANAKAAENVGDLLGGSITSTSTSTSVVATISI